MLLFFDAIHVPSATTSHTVVSDAGVRNRVRCLGMRLLTYLTARCIAGSLAKQLFLVSRLWALSNVGLMGNKTPILPKH